MTVPLFVSYDGFRVGAILDGVVHDVCGARHVESALDEDHARHCLTAAAADWDALAGRVTASPGIPLGEVDLLAPIPHPVNVFGAPVNYLTHAGELGEMRSPSKGTVRELGLFVKAVGSLSGPGDPIVLPVMPGREFHYEGEIAVVIGDAVLESGGEDLDAAAAEAAILGYTGALDITLRLEEDHREERSMRKSYRTFTPVGPAILPHRAGLDASLGLSLSVNGETRQQSTLASLVMGVVELVKLASLVVRLQPGDLILTGTPDGVGPLSPGDRVALEVDGLPALQLNVTERGGA